MDPLPPPPLLLRLIADGRWPRDRDAARRQNSTPLVSIGRIRAFAPDEDGLYLDPPPFATVRALLARHGWWAEPQADPGGIDPDRALVIGDFGLGSDAPIVLDYRPGLDVPRVLRLRWSRAEGNRWVEVAPDFAGFVALLGL